MGKACANHKNVLYSGCSVNILFKFIMLLATDIESKINYEYNYNKGFPLTWKEIIHLLNASGVSTVLSFKESLKFLFCWTSYIKSLVKIWNDYLLTKRQSELVGIYFVFQTKITYPLAWYYYSARHAIGFASTDFQSYLHVFISHKLFYPSFGRW